MRNVRARMRAGLLAAVLVLGACSDSETGDEVSTDEVTSTVAGAAETTVAGEAPTSAAPTDTAAPPPPPPGGGTGPDPAPPGTAPASPSTTPRDPSAPPVGGVGSFAPFYLRASASRDLILEIRSQAGAEPRERSVSHLRETLRVNSGKQVGLAQGAIAGGARSWTADEIRALADQSTHPHSRERAVMRILYLRGGFADSDTALGVAVRSDVAAVFSDRVDEAAGLTGDPARIEDAVTMHEAGHLLGLVDLFLSTGRADPEHRGHSPNRESVMYYAVESTLVGSILTGGPPIDFDTQDRADLATIRRG